MSAPVPEIPLRRHADHDPGLICRPALGFGLCELLEPDEGDGSETVASERPPRPAAEICGQCGEVCDDWVWDDEDEEWEADFECWHHPATGHAFLCCRRCWLEVHWAHCGRGVPCLKPAEAS